MWICYLQIVVYLFIYECIYLIQSYQSVYSVLMMLLLFQSYLSSH